MSGQYSGVWLTLFLCCGWPLIVHFALLYGVQWINRRDWQNLKLPWRKDQ
jgi:hypothetical protein